MISRQKQFTDIYKKFKLPKDCPGLNWRNHGKGFDPDRSFDKELLPLLKEINNLPFCHTTGSCAGHSLREMSSGSSDSPTGWGIKEPYRITLTIHLKTDDESIKKFIVIAQAFAKVSNGGFFCELGWHQLDEYQDFNKVTEAGYMPLDVQVFADTKSRRDRILEKYTKILANKLY
jgi:hypothetical protein